MSKPLPLETRALNALLATAIATDLVEDMLRGGKATPETEKAVWALYQANDLVKALHEALHRAPGRLLDHTS
ncbi:hypothetical protein [Roseixanthobacter pseudopolyaromaticivorans]|uniref:hypothetical protein n=1 Tax=Xanthobacteraceae TaxID=335928 RepID=UPI00372C2BE5